MRRVMCVWFPLWPIQRLQVEWHARKARAVTAEGNAGARREEVLGQLDIEENLGQLEAEETFGQVHVAQSETGHNGGGTSHNIRNNNRTEFEAPPHNSHRANGLPILIPSCDADKPPVADRANGLPILIPSCDADKPPVADRANDAPILIPSRDADKPPVAAVAVFEEMRRGLQVVVCNPEARRWGIRVGMPLGEVRSLLPPPRSAKGRTASSSAGRAKLDRSVGDESPMLRPLLRRADRVGDRNRLQKLAVDCQRYSPLAGLEDVATPESIWLDVSGSEALFGGERGMAEAIQADLGRQGFRVRIAIADSWGAAWGVSHFGNAEISLIPAGEQQACLSTLLIGSLRISEATRETLQGLDVATVGQLLALPRSSLPSRFGVELVRRIDQALGTVPELLTAERPTEPLFVEWSFEEPIGDRQSLDHVCEVLLERLLGMLDERRAGLRELACHWLGTTTEPTLLRLLHPTTERKQLFGLLRLQNERRIFMTGVQGVRMEVVEIGLPAVRQGTLFDDEPDVEFDLTERGSSLSDQSHRRSSAKGSTKKSARGKKGTGSTSFSQALGELVNRLSIRLGRSAVVQPRLIPDPQPEFSYQSTPWLDLPIESESDAVVIESRLRCRPLRLLKAPQPLLVHEWNADGLPSRVNRSAVCDISGPERIETGWWRGLDIKRDYYRLGLENGSTLWVFRDRETGLWFLHGLFA